MANRIAQIRQAHGLTQQALAELAGTTAPQISKLENGERRLTVDWMRRIGSALGVDAGALIADGVSTASAYVARPAARERPEARPAFPLAAGMPAAEPGRMLEVAGEAYALVPVFAARAAAGAGAVGAAERVARVPFRLDWLRGVSDAPVDALGVIEVEGDSMEPTLRPGDQILVDTAPARALRADGIYVLRRDLLLQVKRLSRHPVTGRLTIASDNPAYPTYADVDPKDVDVVGRVIWFGRRL